MFPGHGDVVLPDVDALPDDPVLVGELPGRQAIVELIGELDPDWSERRDHEQVVEKGEVTRATVLDVIETSAIAPID